MVWSDKQGMIGMKLHDEVVDVAHQAIRFGCDPHNAAEVLMHAARSVLADHVEFQHAVKNILAHYGIESVN